jgi:hypothetical protein
VVAVAVAAVVVMICNSHGMKMYTPERDVTADRPDIIFKNKKEKDAY